MSNVINLYVLLEHVEINIVYLSSSLNYIVMFFLISNITAIKNESDKDTNGNIPIIFRVLGVLKVLFFRCLFTDFSWKNN